MFVCTIFVFILYVLQVCGRSPPDVAHASVWFNSRMVMGAQHSVHGLISPMKCSLAMLGPASSSHDLRASYCGILGIR